MFFYSDTNKEPFDPRKMRPYHEQKATEIALRHFDNLLFLIRITQEPKSFVEKMQAEKEITICERKIEHWKRHVNFDAEKYTRGCLEKKKLWQMT